MNDRPIYFDYMATTPIDERVIQKMMQYMGVEGHFGNPSSKTHLYGQQAAHGIDEAREQIADVIHASPEEIVFTSGATEAINLALFGACRFYQRKGKHIVTTVTEHKAVLDSLHQLEKEGFKVTYLSPDSLGILNVNDLEKAIQPDTILVSIMHVNNEIGVIQNIAEIGGMLKGRGIVFHVDAAQSLGKLAIDVKAMQVHLMSMSSHKLYGPKGVGALYLSHKPRIRLMPLIYGGGQEGGMRSGTLATHQIVGFGEACALAESLRETEQARLLRLWQQLWSEISVNPNIRLNGHPTLRIPGNLNICIKHLDSETLLHHLSRLAISTTSACASANLQPSYVLKAIGLSKEEALSSIRLSMGRFTKEADVQVAISLLRDL